MAAMGSGAPDSRVEVREERHGGVACVTCEPPQSEAVAVYFHGGGYRLGSADRSTPFAARVAAALATTVVVVDYRLAPEAPFPAALHDAAAVYESLLDGHGGDIVVMGDSAGGGLAASLAVAADRSGIPAPSALILLSPWLDLTCGASTYGSRAGTDKLFSHQAAREAAEMYLQGHDPTDPLASPNLADLESWPPSLVLASTDEVLLGDSLVFASTLASANNPVVACFVPGVPHVWPTIDPGDPRSAAAIDAMTLFLRSHKVLSGLDAG
jgi:acetyl esterase/lipase